MYELLVGIQIAGIVIGMILINHVIHSKISELVSWVLLSAVCVELDVIGYLFELLATSEDAAIVAVKIQYLGKTYLEFFIFVFIVKYCNIKISNIILRLLFTFHTVILVLVFTCNYNNLYYSSISYDYSGMFPHLVLEFGVVYVLNTIVMISYMFSISGITLMKARNAIDKKTKISYIHLGLMAILTGSGFIVYLMGIGTPYDVTQLFMILSLICYSHIIVKFGFLITIRSAGQDFLDNMNSAMIILDATNSLLYCNNVARKLFPEVDGAVLKREAVIKGIIEISSQSEYSKDGRYYDVEVRYVYNNNIVIGRTIVFTDITKIKQYMYELRAAYEVANKANTAKSKFLWNMSHDMRTPMNAIIGMTAIAKKHEAENDKIYDCLDKIDVSSKHLLRLINDVLDMTKIENDKMTINEEPFAITDLMGNIFAIIEPQVLNKNIAFSKDISDIRYNYVYGDMLRIQQVFINILGNAIKFTDAKGTISVMGRDRLCDDKKYAVYTFVFKDTGIGMDKEFIGHIFEPFERAKTSTVSKVEGIGLGMTISKSIMDNMGGTITVDSRLGEGSKFTVEFPLRLRDDYNANSQSDDDDIDLTGKKILVVEDNEINMDIALEILKEIKADVETAVDGSEAVELFKKSPVNYYDAILMDIQMPVMDGYTASLTIRDCNREDALRVPIIAMTANTFADDIEKAKQAKMNAHVAKPVDVQKLIDALKENMV